MEYSKCYIYQADDARPIKHRRIERSGLQASWEARREAYRAAWEVQKEAIDATIQRTNQATVSDISRFLDDSLEQHTSHIPTAFILGGLDTASTAYITKSLSERSHGSLSKRIFVNLTSNSGSNLKSLLKVLIKTATSSSDGIDDEDEDLPSLSARRTASKLLNYDLQILFNHVREHQIRQVVVTLGDTEAFEGDVLSELLSLMSRWRDRIPFTCLFSIATSVELLQQRLTKEAIKCVAGTLFDVAPAIEQIEQVFEAVVISDTPLKIGSSLAKWVLERQSEYILDISSLIDAVQYAYMSHFYANALSIFLVPDLQLADVPVDHFEALRSLPTFRSHAKALISHNSVKVKSFLDSDQALFEHARTSIKRGQDKIQRLNRAIDVIRYLQSSFTSLSVSAKSRLYIQAVANTLNGSPQLRMVLLAVRKAPSDIAMKILEKLRNFPFDVEECFNIVAMPDSLAKLLSDRPNQATSLRSEEDVAHSTLRTTVVAQKVELSKKKSAISKEDAAYTAILRSLADFLQDYFTNTLIDVQNLEFREVFVYDFRSPHREVFTPRPRHAVERALSTPHDYLDCDCCAPAKGDGDEASLSATQPATAVLYQLYLESGTLINAADLLRAFHAVMGEDKPEVEIMAMYQQALAELKYLGLVKMTRRRVDHIAKVAWPGL